MKEEYEIGVLSGNKYDYFWVEWPQDTTSRTIRVGKGVPGENVIMTYDVQTIDPWPFGLVEAC